jgi:hypothetical protein
MYQRVAEACSECTIHFSTGTGIISLPWNYRDILAAVVEQKNQYAAFRFRDEIDNEGFPLAEKSRRLVDCRGQI